MFKNSLKIIVLVGMLALSMVPAVASFSMQTPTVLTNHLKKSSLMSSLQFCRTTLRPDLLIRKHPVITLCVGLGFCAYGLATYGLIKCYSGLSPNKDGKNSNNTDSQKTVFERFKTMTNVNKIKTLFCPLVFMYSFIQPQVWTEFVDALNHITAHEQIEEKIEEKKEEEEILTKEELVNLWWKKFRSATIFYMQETDQNKKVEKKDAIKSIWKEMFNKDTKKSDFQDIPVSSLFYYAITFLDFEQVKQLVDLGVDVNEIPTPLILATSLEKIEVVKLLIEHGANPNAQNNVGNTALHEAAIKNNNEICRYLFEHGALATKENLEKKAPWQMALFSFKSSDGWIEYLYQTETEYNKAKDKNIQAFINFSFNLQS